MNAKQLQYAIELSKVLNFSQVAEQLHITQPALSKQILNLENELGVKLFDRSNTPMTLTPAGQHFIQEAQELLYMEDQLLRAMEQYRSGQAGELVIGTTPFRSSYLIPAIMKDFHAAYPHIRVKLLEENSQQLRQDAAAGKYDFAVVNLPVDDSVLDVYPLEPDRLVLVVPQEYQHLLPLESDNHEIDFGICRELPFVVLQPNQEMRLLLDRLCATHDFHPKIVAEVVGITTSWAMACAGVGAAILPLQYVRHRTPPEGVTILPIRNAPYTRQPAIITRRGQYISPSARYAIDLLISRSK